MAKAVKMADIAEKLGVSIVTVSKALNGKDGVGSVLRSENSSEQPRKWVMNCHSLFQIRKIHLL